MPTDGLKGLSPADSAHCLDVPGEPILLGFRGSVAHGMYVPPSEPTSVDDKDLMGVYVGPLEHYIGFPRRICDKAVERFREPWDVVHYEVRKFVGLLVKANPNVLSLLWLHETDYVDVTPLGKRLIDARDLFATRAAYHSFAGYARSQLSRMERFEHHGRMGAKRKALVEEFGYDTKNAAHLVRLLRMGIEFLTEGTLHVKRDDAPELLAIKRGEWTLERIKAESDRLFALAEQAYLASPLPPKCDRAEAERLVMEIVADHHGIELGRTYAD